MTEFDDDPETSRQEWRAEDWIRGLLGDRQLDGAMAQDIDPSAVAVESIVNGTDTRDILEARYRADPNILLKNELLIILLEQSRNSALHIDDFIALLERQASGMEGSQEVRYRQFMGLLDILTIAARNRGLIEALRHLEPEIIPED